jgi:hypothetical protein
MNFLLAFFLLLTRMSLGFGQSHLREAIFTDFR